MFLRFAAIASVGPLLCLPTTAWADPTPAPAPPIPNVNAYTPLSPAEFAVAGGSLYAFAGPPGVTCAINRQNSDYACSGALPGAPDGANVVSGAQTGPPAFSSTPRPLFEAIGAAKPLPANTRLSVREISCGIDGTGTVACLNSRDQVGFVVSPTTSYVNASSPLLARPEGTPILPGLPPVMPGRPPG